MQEIKFAYKNEGRKAKLVKAALDARLHYRSYGVMKDWMTYGRVRAIAVAFIDGEAVSTVVYMYDRQDGGEDGEYFTHLYNLSAYTKGRFRKKGLATKLIKRIKRAIPNGRFRHTHASVYKALK